MLTADEVNDLSLSRSSSNRLRARRTSRILWVATIAMFLALAWVLQAQIASTLEYTTRMCEQRQRNVLRTNAAYSALADIERTNKFVDAAMRQKRVAIYSTFVLDVPVCDR